MLNMKRDGRISALNLILNLIIGLSGLICIAAIIQLPSLAKENGLNIMAQLILGLSFISCFFLATLALKKILKSIRNNDPFNLDNVNHFKTIGYCFMTIALIYTIISYPLPNSSGLDILATSYGSIKPTSFLYLILSIMSFILGDVFRMAREIKEENDLTV